MIALIQKIWTRYKSVLLYLLFGALTTAVNYAVYYPLYNLADMSATLSNILAWCAAVIFAFITNKPIVFSSTDWSVKIVIEEFTKFVGCRIASGFGETLIIYVTVELLGWNGNIVKLAVSVLVVIANYFASKFVVFNKNQGSN